MRVGILGGSFNPVHNGHITLARAAKQILDEVWLMPCKNHPLDKKVEGVNYRVDMLNLAIGELEGIRLSDFELNKEGKNYTYQTLRCLKQKFPDKDFYWAIGSDLLYQLPGWHGYEILQKEAEFLVFQRPNYEFINPGINITAVVKIQLPDISSTEIRKRIKQCRSITDLVPKAVEEYIARNNLYKN